MSHLIRETDTELFLYDYLHGGKDEWPQWLSDDGNFPGTKYPEHVIEAEHYALYEVRIDYKINKKTGEITILGAS